MLDNLDFGPTALALVPRAHRCVRRRRLEAGARGSTSDEAQDCPLARLGARLAAEEDRSIGAGVAAQGTTVTT